jgi:hypothetical protein
LAIATALFSGSVQGASLTLFTDASPAAPLTLTPVDAAEPLLVRVENAAVADPPSEFLTAWQLRLQIVPQAGATGTLAFGDAVEPDTYVFDGVGHFGPSVSTAGDQLFAGDFNFPATGGVQVPGAPGTGLLSITLTPSSNALGRFGIYARAGLTNCEWTDAASPVQHRRTFANVPDAGGPVRIADVLVTSVADYNRNGVVDAADYVVWRDTLGQSGTGLVADGNFNNQVDPADYDVWRAHFGVTATSGVSVSSRAYGSITAIVPEPTSRMLFVLSIAALLSSALRRSNT